MRKNIYKIVSLLLALALVMMPLRLAHADTHAAHAHPASLDTEVSKHTPGHPAMSGHGHTAMNEDACTMPSPSHGDQDQTSKTKPNHCYTGAHCCVALLDSPLDTAHAAPSIPKLVLSVAVTGITVPAETKPPRSIL
ncbi:MAG: hypothetical protein ACOY4D_10280 [Pseudomonadota bacterium]